MAISAQEVLSRTRPLSDEEHMKIRERAEEIFRGVRERTDTAIVAIEKEILSA